MVVRGLFNQHFVFYFRCGYTCLCDWIDHGLFIAIACWVIINGDMNVFEKKSVTLTIVSQRSYIIPATTYGI